MTKKHIASLLRLGMIIALLASAFLQTQTVFAASLPAEINKQFTPLQIDAGGVSVLRVTIFNPNSFQLTSAGWTDNLIGVQPGLYIANPAGVVNTCGGSVAATPGTTTLALSGGTVPPQVGPNPGECYVEVNVSSITSGNLINTIPANNLTSQGNDGGTPVSITNTTPASATITVIAVNSPSLSKGFSPNTIFVGETSRLTITLNNNDSDTNLTGVSYTDTLPAGLVLATPVNATVTNCGSYSLTAIAGTDIIALSGATVAPSPNCVVAVDVTGATGTYTNTIPAGPGGPGSIQTDQGVTNNSPANANLNIQPVDIDKSFSPTSFQAGGTSTLTITLENPTGAPYTNISISDTLPGAFVINSPANVNNTCGGTLTATPGTNLISLSGGTIPASASPPTPVGSCVISLLVTAPAASSGTNTIPANNLTSPDHPGLTNITAATATISTYAVGTGISAGKSFSPSTILAGSNTRIRIQLTAPQDTNLTNFSITDNLPAGVTISNSSPATKSGACIGGTLTATTGATSFSWTGGTINAGQQCTIDVYGTSSTPGTVTNIITPTDITNNENRGPSGNITSNLTVNGLSDLSVSKEFYPDQVVPSGVSTLTITLQNTNANALINVSLLDALSTMGSGGNTVVIANPANASTTCGGALTAVPATQNISLSGGTIPAQVGGIPGICTITVNVQAGTSVSTGGRVNRIPVANVSGEISGVGTVINSQAEANDRLYVLNLTIGVVKGFNPVLVYGGASSTLSVQLINPNNATLEGIAFTDDMTLLGSGFQIANPASLNVGTCGGVLTGNPGDTSFSFSGGSLPPNTNCTLTLSVTMTVNGNLTNLIPAGAVTTLNGVSSPDPTQASLTNLPGVSVNKVFSPATVLTGEPSTLSITITNTSLVPVVNMGVADGLPGTLPDGLAVASPANSSNTCGGTLTAVPGSQTITLAGGGLAAAGSAGDVCTVSVDVVSTRPGVYVNTIPAGALTADGGVTNNDPTTDTLTVNAAFSLGNRVWFDTDNSGAINGSEVGVDGVTVQLYAADGSGNPTGAVLGTDTTAGGGYYRFDGLAAGDYVVVIPASQLGTGGALDGYVSSGTNISGVGVVSETAAPDPDNNTDSDDNGTLQTAGTFNGAVLSSAVTLGPTANEPTNDNDPVTNPESGEEPDNQSNRTVDFGFYRGQLGNLVFVDVNGNGTYDAGDTLLSGATVQLYAANGTTEINVGPDGILGTADDAAGGVTTGAGGTYQFSGLPAGDYIVRVTPPAGYVSTVDTASSADTTDPDTNTDNNDNGVGTGSGAVSSNAVTLTPGSTGTQTNNTVTDSTGTTYDPTLDFGFPALTNPGISKTLTGSNQIFTTNPNVAIGEVVEYTVNVTIPPGVFANSQMLDAMERGLSFMSCASITPSDADLTTDVAGSFASACSTPTVDDAGGGTTVDVGRRVTFDLGTLTNASGADQTLTFVYTAVVLDSAANVSGVTLSNSAEWSSDSGSLPPSSATVLIMEPDVSISKTANTSLVSVGSEITITLNIQHTGSSETDAYDTLVTDILPTELEFVTGTLECVSGAQNADVCDYDIGTRTVSAVWNNFTLAGGNGRVTFRVTVVSLPSSGISNVANVAWTSLPGIPTAGPGLPAGQQNTNVFSTERDYDPASNVDVYGTSDTLVIGVFNSVPATGFAPNEVTDLGNAPSVVYKQTGGVTVEIPSLGITLPIVGVPLKNGEWDVSWLGNQAGWLDGTAFPSWSGNSVLTSHVYGSNGLPGPFVNLNGLRYGDKIIVRAYGQTYTYEVRANTVVEPNDASIFRHEEKAWLTLVTCKEYDETTNTYGKRVVVRAVLVGVSR